MIKNVILQNEAVVITKRRKLYVIQYAGEMIHHYRKYKDHANVQVSTFYTRRQAAERCTQFLNELFNTDEFTCVEIPHTSRK